MEMFITKKKKVQYQDLNFVESQRWPEVDCKEGHEIDISIIYHMVFKENYKKNTRSCYLSSSKSEGNI